MNSLCLFLSFFTHIYFPASGQAVVTGVVPSFPRLLPSFFIAHRILPVDFPSSVLSHALALSASQFVRKKKSPRIYTSMHSGGFELTKLTYSTRGTRITWYVTGPIRWNRLGHWQPLLGTLTFWVSIPAIDYAMSFFQGFLRGSSTTSSIRHWFLKSW